MLLVILNMNKLLEHFTKKELQKKKKKKKLKIVYSLNSYIYKNKILWRKNQSWIRFFNAYKLDTWSWDLNSDFTLKDCLFEGVKFAKNADLNKYLYSGYSTGLNLRSEFFWFFSQL